MSGLLIMISTLISATLFSTGSTSCLLRILFPMKLFLAPSVHSAHFGFEEFFFAFVKFLGDNHPRSRLVMAAKFLAGRIFTVVWVGVVIDREVDPGDGFGQRCYRDWHSFSMGVEDKVDG